MKATIEYIERRFAEFNQQMFEGKLQPLPFKLTSARTFLGQLRYVKVPQRDGSTRFDGFQFVISTQVDLPEGEVEDTIIHEMIHYYILSNQMHDTSAHGEIFHRMMYDINRRFNRAITVVHQRTREEEDQDTEECQHLLCVTRLRTNQMYVTLARPSRLLQLWDAMPQQTDVAECQWYTTRDPYFNRYPRALTPKLYRIPYDELMEHLAGATRLVRRGNNIVEEK